MKGFPDGTFDRVRGEARANDVCADEGGVQENGEDKPFDDNHDRCDDEVDLEGTEDKPSISLL